jgi:hypothetical protein
LANSYTEGSSKTARSNLIEVLAGVSRAHPVIGTALRAEVDLLARSRKESLARKAAFVAAGLHGVD